VLLDFSGGNKMEGKSGGQMTFPQSPSVSVHIVKSPAPSPLIAPSPHSASPCITDDELMDEAVIGIGK
jgi:mediator of RNA polymerase II transcription subunit 1